MEETSVAGDPGPDAGTSTAPNAAPEPVARRQRILFVGEAATLAHVVRPFVLARSLDPSRYEVHFACDPRFNKLLGPLPFPHHPIHIVPSEEVLLKIAQGRLFYNTRTLRKYIAADRKILNEIAPDVVVGDNRLSLSVSARLAGIPYIAIANAYWSPQARRRFPLPDVPWTRFFGVRPVSILYRLYRPLIFALYRLPLNWLRRKHGLSSLGWDLCRIFTDGDYTLYADVPELVPTYNLPANHRYLGPVLWSPDVKPPTWWHSLPTDRPIIYATLGSSGGKNLLQVVLNALGRFTRDGDRGHRWPEPPEERAGQRLRRGLPAGRSGCSALRRGALQRRQPDDAAGVGGRGAGDRAPQQHGPALEHGGP